MQQSCPYGSVRGAAGDRRPYRDTSLIHGLRDTNVPQRGAETQRNILGSLRVSVPPWRSSPRLAGLADLLDRAPREELAIRRRFSTRLEDRLRGLEKRVATGRLKDDAKIERLLGRLQASYASVADLYDMTVRDEDGQLRIHWTLIEDRRAWRDAREGAYLLRTNLVGQTVEELWTKYIQLTEAEAAFRALKSELAVRPVFHQLERRAKAHLLIAFLGYALWVTLKHLLHRRGTGLTPTRALAQLATLQSADIVLPTTDGREIRLRRVTQPTLDQQRLLDQLEITIPTHLEWNAECSGDFVAS
jgi:hypothetical protein